MVIVGFSDHANCNNQKFAMAIVDELFPFYKNGTELLYETLLHGFFFEVGNFMCIIMFILYFNEILQSDWSLERV